MQLPRTIIYWFVCISFVKSQEFRVVNNLQYTFDQARTYCQKNFEKGDLAVFRSEEAREKLFQATRDALGRRVYGFFWIGLSRKGVGSPPIWVDRVTENIPNITRLDVRGDCFILVVRKYLHTSVQVALSCRGQYRFACELNRYVEITTTTTTTTTTTRGMRRTRTISPIAAPTITRAKASTNAATTRFFTATTAVVLPFLVEQETDSDDGSILPIMIPLAAGVIGGLIAFLCYRRKKENIYEGEEAGLVYPEHGFQYENPSATNLGAASVASLNPVTEDKSKTGIKGKADSFAGGKGKGAKTSKSKTGDKKAKDKAGKKKVQDDKLSK